MQLSESIKVTKCEKCGEAVRVHRACAACGFYKGKDVLSKPKAAAPAKKVVAKKTEEPEKAEKKPKKGGDDEVTTIKAE